MSDVFGSKPAKSSGTPSGAAANTGHGKSHYVEFDNESGGMTLTLPPHLARYKEELAQDLYQEYFLANPDEGTFDSISEFIDDWLSRKQEADGTGGRRGRS